MICFAVVPLVHEITSLPFASLITNLAPGNSSFVVISCFEITTLVTSFFGALYIIIFDVVPSAFTVNLIHSVYNSYPAGAAVSHNV